MNNTLCDIIIPVCNRLDLTEKCFASIRARTHSPYRLIVIDNGSDAETKTFLEDYRSSHEGAILVRNHTNAGWVKAVNQGLRLSAGPFVCIMNNDTVVKTDGWLAQLIEIARLEGDIGLVNPNFKTKRDVSTKKPYIEADFCRGYCIVVRRAVIEKVGYLDESYGLGYYDDDDYSVRAIRAGFRCVRANYVFVEHVRDSTFSSMFGDDRMIGLHERNKMLFYLKWGRRLRLLFIITREKDRKNVSDLFFSLARRQHVVYVWNVTAPLGLEHINIRERLFPRLAHQAVFWLLLCFNKRKREARRYDIVFVDAPRLQAACSVVKARIYKVDAAHDMDRIREIVDSSAGVPCDAT